MDPHTITTEAKMLLDMMGIHSKELSVSIDNDLQLTILSLRVSGTEQELFIQNFNELKRDFGLLFKELLKKKHHYYKDIIIDINGQDKKFINQTKEKASIAVERVQFFDKPYEFGYLNAYERMLIHTYLKNTPEIITESTGEGKDRRLNIKKKAS